jgi:hypothetical protein
MQYDGRPMRWQVEPTKGEVAARLRLLRFALGYPKQIDLIRFMGEDVISTGHRNNWERGRNLPDVFHGRQSDGQGAGVKALGTLEVPLEFPRHYWKLSPSDPAVLLSVALRGTRMVDLGTLRST